MLQHPKTKEPIECTRPERHREHICLYDQNIASRTVRREVRINRIAEVEGHDGRARVRRLLSKSAGPAAHLEYQLAALVTRVMRLQEKSLL
jgi:hypothetical protein